ncbi:PH domain-containing protein [Haloarchaeobius sp. HME9146]|uniref:PH domain-containing protein n=1 Tax=Haloarchaeobius sp. HME9146 TaxID=2978732 RepID=UPI0021C1D399|nr:PH domain-containing protein [Haloarchaeobius sp. HME9146]MCT9096200.1 PH domain-containing protein [Haloarchaeobius sp. HME9146]
MTESWFTADEGEEVLWTAKPRIQSVLPSLLVSLFVLAGAATLVVVTGETLIVVVGLVIALLPPVAAYFQVINTEYLVTNQACYRKTGGLSRTVLSADFESVQNSSYEQSAVGNLFGYGTVEIDTAGGGGTELAFWNVEDPASVQRIVLSQKQRYESTTDIPGSLDQWRAVRDEVRRLRNAVERYEVTKSHGER